MPWAQVGTISSHRAGLTDTSQSKTPLNFGIIPYDTKVERSFDMRPKTNYRADSIGLHPANERRRYKVTPSLIDWMQT